MAISLDHHATTPTASEVVEAMAPFWTNVPWNAHSSHAGGGESERAVAKARRLVADLIGAAPQEIVFTSGATEANNIAILGLAHSARAEVPHRRRILTSAIEHKCVLDAAWHLAQRGFQHELIPVGADGLIDLDCLKAMMGDDVLLVSVMAANNEIGTVQPLRDVARLCGNDGAMFHVDAAQAVGRTPFDVVEVGCDFASFSAHKMYGPNGIGALFVSAAAPIRLRPIMFGGGQEGGLRPGTLPVPLIVGFGRAAELAQDSLSAAPNLRNLADLFLARLRELGFEPSINGHLKSRLPGSVNFRIAGIDAEDVVRRLDGRLLLSTGSACQSGELQGSYVLRAMGLNESDVFASFRACFGRDHAPSDAVEAANILAETLNACQNPAGRRVQWERQTGGAVRVE